MGLFKENARPLPEILDGEDWEVRNSHKISIAYVDFEKKQFVVPFEKSDAGELVRAHEAMHVKISPRKAEALKQADFVTLQSIEDCRIWQGLRLCGIRTDKEKARIWKDKELTQIFKESSEIKHPQRMADAAFATIGCGEEKIVRELVNSNDPSGGKILEVVDEISEKYFRSEEKLGNLPEWETTVKAAKELTERIKELFPEMPPPPSAGDSNSKGKIRNLTEQFVPGDNDSDEVEFLSSLTKEEAKEAQNWLPKVHQEEWRYDEYRSGKPGIIKEIQTPKLDKVIKFRMSKSIKQNPSDEGVIPLRMNRYATDMKLFNRKGKRRAGAAVLIDVSGSMSLSHDEVRKIIHQCPASIVAVYSSQGGKTGDLRIIAEKSRYTEKLNSGMGRANVVDIPALEWLAKRKESRKLWISDGWITCEHESAPSGESLRKCLNILRSAKIERVGNVKSLIQSGKLIDRAFDDGHKVGQNFTKGK